VGEIARDSRNKSGYSHCVTANGIAGLENGQKSIDWMDECGGSAIR